MQEVAFLNEDLSFASGQLVSLLFHLVYKMVSGCGMPSNFLPLVFRARVLISQEWCTRHELFQVGKHYLSLIPSVKELENELFSRFKKKKLFCCNYFNRRTSFFCK